MNTNEDNFITENNSSLWIGLNFLSGLWTDFSSFLDIIKA
jgi:hypothetical protein